MLNRIQKQFVKLAIMHKANWMVMPGKSFRRGAGGMRKKWPKAVTKVKIINAVTGEVTIAKAYDDSPTTLKRWLKMRNVRAQFADMIIKKGSTWQKLYGEDLKNYPVIVQMGTTKFPYVIDHLGDFITIGKKTMASLFLRTIENVDYLNAIAEKKALLVNTVKPVKIVKKKEKKKKK